MLHTVIFIGRSGSGKGTQAGFLREYLSERDFEKRQILYIETGHRFREFIRAVTFSSEISNKLYKEDRRQPDFLACWMWSSILIEELDKEMHLVIDGAPRSVPEAEILDTAMKFYKRENPTVIHLDISKKTSEKRLLSRGRTDDRALSKIDKRMEWFDKDVMPAIEYYKYNPDYNFIEVDGDQTMEKVHKDILEAYEYKT